MIIINHFICHSAIFRIYIKYFHRKKYFSVTFDKTTGKIEELTLESNN